MEMQLGEIIDTIIDKIENGQYLKDAKACMLIGTGYDFCEDYFSLYDFWDKLCFKNFTFQKKNISTKSIRLLLEIMRSLFSLPHTQGKYANNEKLQEEYLVEKMEKIKSLALLSKKTLQELEKIEGNNYAI